MKSVAEFKLRGEAQQALVSISAPSRKVHTPEHMNLEELDAKEGDVLRVTVEKVGGSRQSARETTRGGGG